MEYASTPAPTELVSFNVIAELRIVGLSRRVRHGRGGRGRRRARRRARVRDGGLAHGLRVRRRCRRTVHVLVQRDQRSCVELYNVTRDLCTWTTVDSEAYSPALLARKRARRRMIASPSSGMRMELKVGATRTGGITLDEAETSGDADAFVGCFNATEGGRTAAFLPTPRRRRVDRSRAQGLGFFVPYATNATNATNVTNATNATEGNCRTDFALVRLRRDLPLRADDVRRGLLDVGHGQQRHEFRTQVRVGLR